MTALRVQIPEKIGAIFAPKENIRYRVAYGGRGSGKSIAFARMLLLEALNTPGKYLCCRELQKSIKTSVHSLLAAEIVNMGLSDYFDVGKEYLRTKDETAEFLFFGLRSNAEEIKSTHGIRIAWIEEAQAVSQFSLDMLIPTIREDGSEIWATFNPQDELDPVYEMFVTNPRRKSAVCEVNYDENPWFPDVLDDERIECLETAPEKYNWIWLGQLYVNVNAAVYGKWVEKAKSDGRFKENIYDPSLPVFTAWDLGYSDDTAIWWFQVAGNEIRAIDYYENNRQDMRHYAEQIYGREIIDIQYGENGKVLSYKLGKLIAGIERRAKYTYGDSFVPHDAANKLLQAGGRSVVDQLHEFGIKSRIVEATSQQNQISAGRAAIDLAWFDPMLCKQGIRCLKKYAFEERDGEKGYSTTPKHDVYSHGCFTGDTLVLTLEGLKPIMSLPKIGKIRTLSGWKKYKNPHITRQNAPLVKIVFSDNTTVKCTPDHLFLTENGWKSAESLTPNTVIQSSLTKKPKPLMGWFTSYGKKKDIYQEKQKHRLERCIIVAKDCIGMFGNLLLEKYQKIVTFITKMGIQLTTHWKTLSVCNQTSILGLHGEKQSTKERVSGFLKRLEKRLHIGIDQKRAADGIKKNHALKQFLSVLRKIATSAALFIKLYCEETGEEDKNFAPLNAKPLRIKSVTKLEERQDVWCLTVPDVGHFSLSNGAIVKNCDAWEVLARVWKSAKIDTPPPKPRFLHEMTVNELFESTPTTGTSRI